MGVFSAAALAAMLLCDPSKDGCQLYVRDEVPSGVTIAGKPIERYSECSPPYWEHRPGETVRLIVTLCPEWPPRRWRGMKKTNPNGD